MKIVLTLVAAVTMVGAAGVLVRRVARRWRTVRRLAAAERKVAEAIEDGRLSRSTGQAVLQHLEGLRRSVAGFREG